MKSLPLLALSMIAVVTTRAVLAEDFDARTYNAPGGERLLFRLLIPKNYDAKQKYPLVLFLHGAGERGDDNQAQLKHCATTFAKPENREKYPCFVVVPQCPKDQKWVDIDWRDTEPTQPAEMSPPMKLTIAKLEALQKEFNIDADRLYVSGISMGGFGTWDLITRFPDRWAAAVPICGGGDTRAAAKIATLPIWCFHGDADPAVAVAQSRRMITAVKAAGGAPKYTEYPGVKHESWIQAYNEPELLPWLFAQKRAPK